MAISMLNYCKNVKLMDDSPLSLTGTRSRDSVGIPSPNDIALTDYINVDFFAGRERVFSQDSIAESDVKPYHADCRIGYPDLAPAPVDTLATVKIGTSADNDDNVGNSYIPDKVGKVIWRTTSIGVLFTNQATYMNGYHKKRPGNTSGGRTSLNYRQIGPNNGAERMGYHWVGFPDGYLAGPRIDLTPYTELDDVDPKWKNMFVNINMSSSTMEQFPHIVVVCSAWTPSGTANGTTYEFAEPQLESTFDGGNP